MPSMCAAGGALRPLRALAQGQDDVVLAGAFAVATIFDSLAWSVRMVPPAAPPSLKQYVSPPAPQRETHAAIDQIALDGGRRRGGARGHHVEIIAPPWHPSGSP